MPSPLALFDAPYFARGITHLAGVDEAGRGCLAGPVVAAAVILPEGVELPGVTDSKKLSPAQREKAFDAINAIALSVSVGMCSPAEIDARNILRAALEAMRRAVAALQVAPEHVLVDGNVLFPESPCPTTAVVKGDGKSLCIAAASIVAKVTRDKLMGELHAAAPEYGWAQNKGYPTAAHYAALSRHGISQHHRRSFRLGPR